MLVFANTDLAMLLASVLWLSRYKNLPLDGDF